MCFFWVWVHPLKCYYPRVYSLPTSAEFSRYLHSINIQQLFKRFQTLKTFPDLQAGRFGSYTFQLMFSVSMVNLSGPLINHVSLMTFNSSGGSLRYANQSGEFRPWAASEGPGVLILHVRKPGVGDEGVTSSLPTYPHAPSPPLPPPAADSRGITH